MDIKTKEEIAKDSFLNLFVNHEFESVLYEYKLDGLDNYQVRVEQMLEHVNIPEVEFNIKLILMELLVNAYKHGNDNNDELPIRVRTITGRNILAVEVTDMGLREKKFSVKKEINDEDILSESGRGLFLVEQLSDKSYIDGNSVIVEVSIDGGKKVC